MNIFVAKAFNTDCVLGQRPQSGIFERIAKNF